MIRDQLLLCERDNTDLRIEVEQLRSLIGDLNAERVMAKAEVERLTAERANRYWEGRYRDEKADNERLTAENAELRKSLDTWIAVHGPRALAPPDVRALLPELAIIRRVMLGKEE